MVLALLLAALAMAGAAGPAGEQRADAADAPALQPNGHSTDAAISADGRFIAFRSEATNLVLGDRNREPDVFVRDMGTGITTRVSVATGGAEANGASGNPSITGDGRFVAFQSVAGNLVPGDRNENADVFVHDRDTGRTSRVSVSSEGTEGNNPSNNPAISDDGRYVAFTSYANNLVPGDTRPILGGDVFVHDRETRKTVRVSVSSEGKEANLESDYASIAVTGKGEVLVVFESGATNLVPGDRNGAADVFIHSLTTRRTALVSVTSAGRQFRRSSDRPLLSANGRFVVFMSSLVLRRSLNAAPFVRDLDPERLTTRPVEALAVGGDDVLGVGGISADGESIAVYSDGRPTEESDSYRDVFVSRLFGLGRRDGALEADTTWVSEAYTWDEENESDANGGSDEPVISGDGRYVAFSSWAGNLVPGDTNGTTDIFRWDRERDATEVVSLPSATPAANESDGASDQPSISDDGTRVAFRSFATNLVLQDINNRADIFLRGMRQQSLALVSVPDRPFLGDANEDSLQPSLSRDGRYVAFSSDAGNLVAPFEDKRRAGFLDVFVRDTARRRTFAVTEKSDGNAGAPSISGDGNTVAFVASAITFEAVFVASPATGPRLGDELLAVDAESPSVSADGRYVAYAAADEQAVRNDRNGKRDIFVEDLESGGVLLVSRAADGGQADGDSSQPDVSADGRVVVFVSEAGNLTADDTGHARDIFASDRRTQQTTWVSRPADGEVSDDLGHSYEPAISADGRYVAFTSWRRNLVSGDRNDLGDVFIRDLATGTITLVSRGLGGTPSNGRSYQPSISGNGRYVAFSSEATNLVKDDSNELADVFVWDRTTGKIVRVSVPLQRAATEPDETGLTGAASFPAIQAVVADPAASSRRRGRARLSSATRAEA